jgi:hypothetical protein
MRPWFVSWTAPAVLLAAPLAWRRAPVKEFSARPTQKANKLKLIRKPASADPPDDAALAHAETEMAAKLTKMQMEMQIPNLPWKGDKAAPAVAVAKRSLVQQGVTRTHLSQNKTTLAVVLCIWKESILQTQMNSCCTWLLSRRRRRRRRRALVVAVAGSIAPADAAAEVEGKAGTKTGTGTETGAAAMSVAPALAAATKRGVAVVAMKGRRERWRLLLHLHLHLRLLLHLHLHLHLRLLLHLHLNLHMHLHLYLHLLLNTITTPQCLSLEAPSPEQ